MVDVTYLFPEHRGPGGTKARVPSGENPEQQSGFSSRLSLLCGLARLPDINSGRAAALCGLLEGVEQQEVVAWLTRDELPSPTMLRDLVRQLVETLAQPADARQWEAFLIYGEEYVANPITNWLQTSRSQIRRRAAETLTTLIRRYEIPADSYDAERLLRDMEAVLTDLQLQDDERDIQPGHLQIIALRLFPDHLADH